MPNWLTTPVVPEAPVRRLQEAIDAPSLERSPFEAKLRGFGAGALEGLRGLTSPLNIASLALPLAGNLMRAPRAVQGLSRAIPEVFQFNPSQIATMERMYQQANPTFKALEEAGTFAGQRTVPTLSSRIPAVSGAARRGQDAIQALAGEVPRALGTKIAEFVPRGGEGTYNIPRTIGPKVLDPLREEAFLKFMSR